MGVHTELRICACPGPITLTLVRTGLRFRDVIKACCLEPDLEMLPHGAETEIGEKGINLSGGQKARVSLARAAYSGAEIVLMDDSLSAVDAYVGKRLLDGCLLRGPLAGRTRVLVTHALHVLDRTDYVYVMDEDAVVEQGTYDVSCVFFCAQRAVWLADWGGWCV